MQFEKTSRLLCAVAFLAVAAGTVAEAEDFACTFKASSTNKDAIPETVFFRIKAGTREVVVIDPFIKGVFDGPTKGFVEMQSADRLRITWKLPIRFGDNVKSYGYYQLTLRRKSGKARLNVHFSEYLNRYNGGGVCKSENG